MLTTILGAFVPSIFRLVESRFGTKSGATKMQTVIGAAKAVLEPLAASGGLGGPAPDDAKLREVLEALLSEEKRKADWQEKGILSVGGNQYVVTVHGKLGEV